MDMNTTTFTIIIIVLIILIAVLLYFFFRSNNSTYKMVAKNIDISHIVDQLNEKGWCLAHMKGCGHCTRQKQLLGEHINRIRHWSTNDPDDRNFEIPQHIRSQIRGYPTWFNIHTNTVSPGYKDISGLLKLLQ